MSDTMQIARLKKARTPVPPYAAFDAIPAPLILWDATPKPQYINPAFTAQLGWTLSDLQRDPWCCFAPTSRIAIKQALATLDHSKQDSKPTAIEVACLTRSGTPHDVVLSISPKTPSKTAPATTVLLMHDITERKREEQSRIQASRAVQEVIDSLPQAIFWKDREGVLRGGNLALAKAAGLNSVNEIAGKTDHDLAWRNEADAFRADDLSVMSKNQPKLDFEEQQTQADGKMRWLRTSKLPLQDQEGNVVGLAGMFSDITAERKAQEDLFRSRQMLQTVMDNIPINICWKDKNSVYLGCNRQFATTLGLSSPEWIVGKTDYDHDSAANAENYMKDDREVMDSDKPRINYEEPLPHPDGSVSWLRSNKIPLHNTAGEVNGVLVMFEDITPAKRYAEEREHLISDLKIANDQAVEAARLKSEFVATMSHELRTPLNAVIGFSGIILEGMAGTVDEVARGMINGIYSSSTSLLGLINEVLDLSRIEAGRMEIFNTEFNLGEKLSKWAEVVTPQLNQKQLTLQVNNDPAMPKLLTGDAERIRQVVVNLLSNAVKFTEKGGIFLETKWQGAQGVEIRVRDTGIGIPPHAFNLIFEDFRQVDSSQQRKYGGSGLGLSIVRKLCTLMGGTIKVQSELGAGSTFIVNLPLKVAQ